MYWIIVGWLIWQVLGMNESDKKKGMPVSDVDALAIAIVSATITIAIIYAHTSLQTRQIRYDVGG